MTDRYEILRINPYEDARGELKKVFKKNNLDNNRIIEEIYVLYTKKDCVRGNHYHRKNVEFFTVIKGTATIAVKDLETHVTNVFRVSAEDNIVIKIPENVAHGFKNEEEEELIILAAASREYEPGETDTFALQLL